MQKFVQAMNEIFREAQLVVEQNEELLCFSISFASWGYGTENNRQISNSNKNKYGSNNSLLKGDIVGLLG